MANIKGTSKVIPNGSEWVQRGGKILTVLEFLGVASFKVKFEDSPVFIAQNKEIKSGKVMNRNLPLTSCVGFLGYGKYKAQSDNVVDPAWEVWAGILKRCYNTERDDYYRYGGAGITVSESWHNYQNFAQWYYDQISLLPEQIYTKYDVDKDLKNGRQYSAENCILLPYKLNNFIQNKVFSNGMGYVKNTKDNPHNKITTTISLLGKQVYIGLHATQKDSDKSYNVAKNYVIRKMATEFLAIGLITQSTANILMKPTNTYTLEDEVILFKTRPTLKGRIDGLFIKKTNLLERCKYKVSSEIY